MRKYFFKVEKCLFQEFLLLLKGLKKVWSVAEDRDFVSFSRKIEVYVQCAYIQLRDISTSCYPTAFEEQAGRLSVPSNFLTMQSMLISIKFHPNLYTTNFIHNLALKKIFA